jgi:hypothetical protein
MSLHHNLKNRSKILGEPYKKKVVLQTAQHIIITYYVDRDKYHKKWFRQKTSLEEMIKRRSYENYFFE